MTELTKAMEQYLETIYELEEKHGSASVTDIADVRGVKAPSVTYVLRKLKKLGLINYKKYYSVSLTTEGRAVAERLEKTHQALKWFFCLIGVDEEIAEADACDFEHTAHPETIEKLAEFADWVKAAPKGPKWLKHFRRYQENDSHPVE